MSPDKQKMLAACKSEPGKIQTIILDDKLNVVNQVIVGVNLSDFTIPAVVTTDNKACIVLTGKDRTRIICFDSKGKKNEIKYKTSSEMAFAYRKLERCVFKNQDINRRFQQPIAFRRYHNGKCVLLSLFFLIKSYYFSQCRPHHLELSRSIEVGLEGPIEIIKVPSVPQFSSTFLASGVGNVIVYNDNSRNLSRAENEKR